MKKNGKGMRKRQTHKGRKTKRSENGMSRKQRKREWVIFYSAHDRNQLLTAG